MSSLLAWLRFGINPGPPTWLAAQRMAEAEERSQRLLRSWLSPEQFAQYDTLGHFTVVGSDTGKRYRMRGRAFNIQELNADDKEDCTYARGRGDRRRQSSSEDRTGELREQGLEDREPKQWS
jgi:hypothetical protein